jgi:predicted ATPase
LAEEFRDYAIKGGQVFISTHSPDFLNAIELKELYCLIKKDGYTKIVKASDNALIKSLYEGGDKLGALWRQGLMLESCEVI